MMSVCEPEPILPSPSPLYMYVGNVRRGGSAGVQLDVYQGEPQTNFLEVGAVYTVLKDRWDCINRKRPSDTCRWDENGFVHMSPYVGICSVPTGPQMGKILADEFAKWQSEFDQRGTVIVGGLSTYAVLEALLRMSVSPDRIIFGPDSCFDPYDEPTAKGRADGILDLSGAAEALRVFHVDADQLSPFAPNRAMTRLADAFSRGRRPELTMSFEGGGRRVEFSPAYVFSQMMEDCTREVNWVLDTRPPAEEPDQTGMARIVALAI